MPVTVSNGFLEFKKCRAEAKIVDDNDDFDDEDDYFY
jgi:hypothetical protein